MYHNSPKIKITGVEPDEGKRTLLPTVIGMYGAFMSRTDSLRTYSGRGPSAE